MPLYTYVVVYNGQSYVAQGHYRNLKGFMSSWAAGLPANALSGLTTQLHYELAEKAYQAPFLAVPHRKNVWTKALEVGGQEFRVYAIQTAEVRVCSHFAGQG